MEIQEILTKVIDKNKVNDYNSAYITLGLADEIGACNNTAIETALRESDIIISAWGCGKRFKERKTFVLDLLRQMQDRLLLKTKSHPSRCPYEDCIQPLDIQLGLRY